MGLMGSGGSMGSGGIKIIRDYILKTWTDYVILNEVKNLSGSTPSDSLADSVILRFTQDDPNNLAGSLF